MNSWGTYNAQDARQAYEEMFGDANTGGFSWGQGQDSAQTPGRCALFDLQEGETEAAALGRVKTETALVILQAQKLGWKLKHEVAKAEHDTLHRFVWWQPPGSEAVGEWDVTAARALVRAAELVK